MVDKKTQTKNINKKSKLQTKDISTVSTNKTSPASSNKKMENLEDKSLVTNKTSSKTVEPTATPRAKIVKSKKVLTPKNFTLEDTNNITVTSFDEVTQLESKSSNTFQTPEIKEDPYKLYSLEKLTAKQIAVKNKNEKIASVISFNDEDKLENKITKSHRAFFKKKTKRIPIEKITRFNPSIKTGLTLSQVEEHSKQGYANIIDNKITKTYRSIFFTNIFTFFNLLCFVVAGALIAVGAYSNLFFVSIFLANILIGIIQEIRAKKTIEKIKLVTSPSASVIREGLSSEIPIEEIVLDDIIKFYTGKQISADCELIDGEIEVNESLLTGESIPVKKKKGDTLYSGSFVVGGKCFAKVVKVGSDSYTAELANKAKKYSKPKSELLGSLRFIIKCIGVVIIPLAILMFYNNSMDSGIEISEVVKKTAGSVIGMIPVGMFLLTSMALAVGIIKLAKKRTLVQDLYSIEMLARADVLCLDKTGTITDGTMKVNSVIQLDTNEKHTTGDIVGSLLTSLEGNDSTSRALASYFGYSKELSAKTILPFSSARKMSAVTFKNGKTYAMGAPEFVYKTRNKEIERLVNQYASRGFRVLMVARCEGEIIKEKLSSKRTPVCLIIIEDHIREDAESTLNWFKENNVAIKVISGDNPLTVSEVSKRVGVPNSELYISLESLSEQQVIDAAEKYTVFGRVSPEQKCILIKALKSKGHKVAMTGDGVNDILALKEADCSIAMASGSEASRLVSHLVLLDSNFSSLPDVVAEGRRVVNNVQNSSSLFLMKTIFTIMLSILCLIFSEVYPFNTLQIILLEICVIGIPSFFLALQPNKDRISGKFLPNLLGRSLPGAMVLVLNVVACFVLVKLGIISNSAVVNEFSTMSSLAVTFTGITILYRLCSPLNVYRGALLTTMLILIATILTVIPFNTFDYYHLSTQNVLFIIVLVQASYPIYATIVKWFTKIQLSDRN